MCLERERKSKLFRDDGVIANEHVSDSAAEAMGHSAPKASALLSGSVVACFLRLVTCLASAAVLCALGPQKYLITPTTRIQGLATNLAS